METPGVYRIGHADAEPVDGRLQPEQLDTPAIVELFGHARLAGRVSEQVIAGVGFVRVDVPATSASPAFTKFFGPSAIYALTPCDQNTMLAAAAQMQARPVQIWLGAPRVLPEPPRQLGLDAEDEDDPELDL